MTSRPWRQCRNGRGKRQPSAATAEDPSFGGARDGFGTDTLTAVKIVLPSSRRREPGKLATLPSILDFGGPVSPPGPPSFFARKLRFRAERVRRFAHNACEWWCYASPPASV